MDKASLRQERADLVDKQDVPRSLLQEQLARLQTADHRLEQLQQVGLQQTPELAVLEVTAEPHPAAAAGVWVQLLLPRPQLRPDVLVEYVRFLAGPDTRVSGQEALHPRGAA